MNFTVWSREQLQIFATVKQYPIVSGHSNIDEIGLKKGDKPKVVN